MSRFRTSAVARLLTCNAIFQRLKGMKTSFYTTYYTKNPSNVDVFKNNEIMLRDLKMYA